MNKDTKQYIYKLSNIVLKWSLVYMIVLFFLEDLKPYLVSTVFSPHWILLVLVISLAGVLVFAPFGHEMDTGFSLKIFKHQGLNKFDIWFFRIVIFGFVLVWMPALWQIIGFWGAVLVLVLAWLSERVLLALFSKK